MHMVCSVRTFAPQVRTLPSVLKFLPSQQARDGGQYINALQYWLGGNAENLENLVLSTAQSYVPALKGVDFNVSDPELFPEVGIWHPLAPGGPTVLQCWAADQAAKAFQAGSAAPGRADLLPQVGSPPVSFQCAQPGCG